MRFLTVDDLFYNLGGGVLYESSASFTWIASLIVKTGESFSYLVFILANIFMETYFLF